jgi:hypothetical protein
MHMAVKQTRLARRQTAVALRLLISVTLLAGGATGATAQTPDPETRQAIVEGAQAEKAATLHAYVPTPAERIMARVEEALSQAPRWHPFFETAYRGGGMPFGVGFIQHLSPYNYVDIRASYTVRNYKRAEVEFVAPRLFRRRGALSVVGGWRDATEVGFFGLGTSSSQGNRANFGFEEPHGSAELTFWPTRELFLFRGGVELSRWSLKQGRGGSPSVDEVYTPRTLPGLGTTTTYVHTHGTIGLDWRPQPGYARRGGFYAITAHDYEDRDDRFGFEQVDYEAVQHVPILRDTWVVSLRARVQTTSRKDGQEVPFYMLPSLGGGTNLRGFSSWRFRDRNSLLMQAEWRIMANRFFDTALFYDSGKVASRAADLDFNGLQHDYGFGARFHTPMSTPLRIDVAKGPDGLSLVFATSPVF